MSLAKALVVYLPVVIYERTEVDRTEIARLPGGKCCLPAWIRSVSAVNLPLSRHTRIPDTGLAVPEHSGCDLSEDRHGRR